MDLQRKWRCTIPAKLSYQKFWKCSSVIYIDVIFIIIIKINFNIVIIIIIIIIINPIFVIIIIIINISSFSNTISSSGRCISRSLLLILSADSGASFADNYDNHCNHIAIYWQFTYIHHIVKAASKYHHSTGCEAEMSWKRTDIWNNFF